MSLEVFFPSGEPLLLCTFYPGYSSAPGNSQFSYHWKLMYFLTYYLLVIPLCTSYPLFVIICILLATKVHHFQQKELFFSVTGTRYIFIFSMFASVLFGIHYTDYHFRSLTQRLTVFPVASFSRPLSQFQYCRSFGLRVKLFVPQDTTPGGRYCSRLYFYFMCRFLWQLLCVRR